jgi:hypothetical protein
MKRLAFAALAFASMAGCATQITPNIEIGPAPIMSAPSNADLSPKSTRRNLILDRDFLSLQFDESGGLAGIEQKSWFVITAFLSPMRAATRSFRHAPQRLLPPNASNFSSF